LDGDRSSAGAGRAVWRRGGYARCCDVAAVEGAEAAESWQHGGRGGGRERVAVAEATAEWRR